MNNLTEKVKRDAGRYTLEEAAKFVAENSNARADSILEKLKKAAAYDRLTVYESGSDEVHKDMPKVRVAPGKSFKYALGDEEAYWNDLNEWLEKNEPRLDCKEFPNPNTLTATAKGEVVRGIPKKLVAAAFQGLCFDYDHWIKNLTPPVSNWLSGKCIAAKGNKKVSTLWNPVLIAAALIDKGITVEQLDAVFFQSLKDWDDEWKETSASFRD